MQESLWKQEIQIPNFPPQSGDQRTDVLIIGGGLAGILCAWQLHRAGADCLLIEAEQIGHGTTGCSTGKITSQHGLIYHKLQKKFGPGSARAYWEANEDALNQYRILAQKLDFDFQSKDHYVYARQDDAKLKQEWNTLKALGIPCAYRARTELPFDMQAAICFPNQAQLHPRKLILALSAELQIREHTRALAIDGSKVITNQGTITASRILVTTHFPIWNKHGGYFLKMYQQRSCLMALENAPLLEGMYLEAGETGMTFRSAGDFLLIGGYGHRTGKPGTGWENLEAFAGKYYPDAKIRFRWAAQDCMTLDGMPYIGQYRRKTPNLYVATGFNKWGITGSMAASMLLTDLLQGRQNPCEKLFSPSRTILRPQLLANAAESTWNLLRPTTPRCPHLGCALHWNPWERSWDCACHGSRFGEKGELRNGPANGDLQK